MGPVFKMLFFPQNRCAAGSFIYSLVTPTVNKIYFSTNQSTVPGGAKDSKHTFYTMEIF